MLLSNSSSKKGENLFKFLKIWLIIKVCASAYEFRLGFFIKNELKIRNALKFHSYINGILSWYFWEHYSQQKVWLSLWY